MIHIVLIGFEYKTNILTGTLFDLFYAYKWCETFMSHCNIKVFTDIYPIFDSDGSFIYRNKNILNEDIIKFYESVNKSIVYNRNTFLSDINNYLQEYNINKLIVYYSGHGIDNNLLLPNETLLPFSEFKNNILSNVNKFTEIFTILDCCNPNKLNLPFKLNNNKFVLSHGEKEFISQPMILIVSSDSTEKSIATNTGSLFSYCLFSYLISFNKKYEPEFTNDRISIPTYKNRNLRRLIGNITSNIRKKHTGYTQNVAIYSSYMIDPILWLWVGSNKDYDIVSDISLTTLAVREETVC